MANLITCDRCNGSGRIGYYSHIDEGVCFKCKGDGRMEKNRAKKGPAPVVITEETKATVKQIVNLLEAGEVVKGSADYSWIKIKLVPHMPGNFEYQNQFGEMGLGLDGLMARVQSDGFVMG